MSKTDWRAVQSLGRMNEPVPSPYRAWTVLNERGDTIASELDEPTARLIAAAPDCVDALQNLLPVAQAFEKQTSKGSGGRRGGHVFTEARAALKKAGAIK